MEQSSKPSELSAAAAALIELFELLQSTFTVPARIELDVSRIEPNDLFDVRGAAGVTMRKLQALHHFSRPDVVVKSDVLVVRLADLLLSLEGLREHVQPKLSGPDLDRFDHSCKAVEGAETAVLKLVDQYLGEIFLLCGTADPSSTDGCCNQ